MNPNAIVFFAACALGGFLFGGITAMWWGLFIALCISCLASML